MSDKPQTTYVALVLDRSGSMSSLREDAVAWYNEQVDEIQGKAGKNGQRVITSLVTFNDEIFEHTVPEITWWAVILTAGSAAAGAALIISGLREKKET